MKAIRNSFRQRGRKAAGGERRAPLHAPATRHALPRVVFVVGPTSSGKTDLGLRLAHELDGEIINADARQVYRDVDIGTGKPRGIWKRLGHRKTFLVNNVPHELMDFLPPEQAYTVSEWRDAALAATHAMTRRKKVPIVVGGTGLYISALIDNYQFPGVQPQPALRQALASKTLEELVRALLVADPGAETAVDLKNKRRVIRALEVVTFSGRKFSEARGKAEPLVEAFQVGIRRTPEDLYARMEVAINHMVEEGLIQEVVGLLKKGVASDTPAMTSIGYRDIVRHLAGEISRDEAIALIKRGTRQYIKRQWTWFKRDPRIHWVKSEEEGVKLVKRWMKKERP